MVFFFTIFDFFPFILFRWIFLLIFSSIFPLHSTLNYSHDIVPFFCTIHCVVVVVMCEFVYVLWVLIYVTWAISYHFFFAWRVCHCCAFRYLSHSLTTWAHMINDVIYSFAASTVTTLYHALCASAK